MSAVPAHAVFVLRERVRPALAEAIFPLQHSRRQPTAREPQPRLTPGGEDASDGTVEEFRRTPDRGIRGYICSNRSNESSREAISEATCANQCLEAPVQFTLERFKIGHGIEGPMDCFRFGRRLEYTLRPIDLCLIQKKIFTPDVNGSVRFLALTDRSCLSRRHLYTLTLRLY